MGYVGWLGHIETVDSVFTSILRKLGAVFYGTSIIILSYCSQNHCPAEFDVRRDHQQHNRVSPE